MARFIYRAMDEKGFYTNGEHECTSKKELEQFLNAKGLFLVSCSQPTKFKLHTEKIKLRDIIIFSRQFSVLSNAGISQDECIRTIAAHSEKDSMRNILNEIAEEMQHGKPLSECMEKHEKVFKYFFISMMKVGEFSGEIDRVLKDVADYYEDEGKLQSKIRGAITYPIILGVMIVAIVIFLMNGIVPQFQDMFSSMGADLPFITQMLIDVSDFVRQNGLILALLLVLFIVGIRFYVKTKKGRYQVDRLIISLPVISKVYTKVVTARFARSMSILLNSGISLMQSFDIIDSLISNGVVLERFKECKESVSLGYAYSSSLEKMNFFPSILLNMVAAGEKAGSLGEVFEKTSSFFDDEADREIDTMIKMIEPVMLVIAGAVIVLVFLSIMLPMFDTIGNV